MQSLTARMPLLMATSVFGLGRRRWSSYLQCYLHCLRTSKLDRVKLGCNDSMGYIIGAEFWHYYRLPEALPWSQLIVWKYWRELTSTDSNKGKSMTVPSFLDSTIWTPEWRDVTFFAFSDVRTRWPRHPAAFSRINFIYIYNFIHHRGSQKNIKQL